MSEILEVAVSNSKAENKPDTDVYKIAKNVTLVNGKSQIIDFDVR